MRDELPHKSFGERWQGLFLSAAANWESSHCGSFSHPLLWCRMKRETWVVRIKSPSRSWINGWMPVAAVAARTTGESRTPAEASVKCSNILCRLHHREFLCALLSDSAMFGGFLFAPGLSSKWLQKPRNFDLTTNQRLPNNKCRCKIYSTERQTLLGICCNYLWQWHMLISQFGTVIRSMCI